MTGLMSVTLRDGVPARQAIPMFDQMAGALAVVGALAMLVTGQPGADRHVEVDLFETGLFMVSSRLVDYQITGEPNHTGALFELAPYGPFQASDGKWLFLGVINDRYWKRFCDIFSCEEASRDERLATNSGRAQHRAYVNELTQAAIGSYGRAEVLDRLHEEGIPSGPIYSFGEVLEDPHAVGAGRHSAVEFDGDEYDVPGLPMNLGINREEGIRPPYLGEHTDVYE
jgi:crotonobetainyl-CoA:carnitine CoA-transferase CaiB-like acyl-CoA transferase